MQKGSLLELCCKVVAGLELKPLEWKRVPIDLHDRLFKYLLTWEQQSYLGSKRQLWWDPNSRKKLQFECHMDERGLFQGEFRWWHPNGQLGEYGFYKDSKLEGEYTAWHPNGNVHVECFYQDGKIRGEYQEWYTNGELCCQYFYNEFGQIEGRCLNFRANGVGYKMYGFKKGKLHGIYQYLGNCKITCWYKNGQLHGEYKEWWSNMQLRKHCWYKNGQRIGEYKEWYRKNQLKKHCWYNDTGKKHGEYKKWYEDGLLKIHCFYKDSLLDGEYIKWNRKHHIEEIHCFYDNGVLHGPSLNYITVESKYTSIPDKSHYVHTTYKHGKLHGKWVKKTKSGRKIEQCYYDNDIINGVYVRWYDKKPYRIEEYGHYTNGMKDGIWLEWDSDGKLRWKINYSNDLRYGVFQKYQHTYTETGIRPYPWCPHGGHRTPVFLN